MLVYQRVNHQYETVLGLLGQSEVEDKTPMINHGPNGGAKIPGFETDSRMAALRGNPSHNRFVSGLLPSGKLT